MFECFESDDSLCLLSRGDKTTFPAGKWTIRQMSLFLVRSNKALCYYRMWGALQIMFSEGKSMDLAILNFFKYCINSTQHIQDTDHQLFLNKDNCFYKPKPVIDHYILNIIPNTISLNQTLGLALIGVQSYKTIWTPDTTVVTPQQLDAFYTRQLYSVAIETNENIPEHERQSVF